MAIDPVAIAITAAMMAAQMGLQAMQKIEGPRLEDLKVTVADHGTPIAYFWGTRRLDVPIVFAEEINEVKRRRKTKGGKYNDYTYYGTWFCLIASHEIEAVKRIWFDKHLVYDATGSGPLTPFSTDETLDVSSHIRIMLGTADQEPDPRMEATLDALHGAGSCSAYRGMSGVMFVDVPLEKNGNRIPQVSIEATRAAVPAFPWETNEDSELGAPNGNLGIAPDFSTFVVNNTTEFEIWDIATRELITSGPLAYTAGTRLVISTNGAMYYARDNSFFTPDELVVCNPGGFGDAILGELTPQKPTRIQILMDGDGQEHVICLPYSNYTTVHDYPIGGLSGVVPLTLTFISSCAIDDAYGDIWVLGGLQGVDTEIFMERIVNTSGRAVADLQPLAIPKDNGLPDYYGCHNAGENHFFIVAEGEWHLIDDTNFTVKDSGAWTGNAAELLNTRPVQDIAFVVGSTTSRKISTRTGETLDTYTMSDWLSEGTDYGFYDPINHALVSDPDQTSFTWRFLDRVGSGTVTLRSIIEDVAEQCGLESGDIDATDCTQTVLGYSITQGSGKAALERLLEIYDVDARPHDFQIQFVRRGDAAIATIASDEFVAEEQRFKITIRQDTDLPVSATMTFADPAGDQQPNTVLVRRAVGASDGIGEMAVNLSSLVLDVDEARQLAERFFRRQWNGRETYEMGLTSRRLAIEPADVCGLTFDGIERTARSTRLTIAGKGYGLRAEWERDAPLLASLTTSTGATFDGRREDEILIPVLSRGMVVDAALAEDVDDQSSPFAYYGAAPINDGFWPSADIFVSEDGSAGTFDTVWATVGSGEAMDGGYCTEALGDAIATVVDYGNTLNVRMFNGTLTSSTEADVLEDGTINLVAVGADGRWEWMQFITATLLGDGSYDLSGFLRGRRGTEHAMAGHQSGDALFVATTRNKRAMGAGDIGDTDHYKPVTQGRGEAGAWSQAVSFTSAALKPYSPVNAVCEKDSGTGDWSIDATRRTRIGGANIDNDSPPLGETSELWEADILDGADVVRTLTGPSLPLTYYDYQQVEDFGATVAVGDLDCNLYQVSPALSLRGYPLAIAA